MAEIRQYINENKNSSDEYSDSSRNDDFEERILKHRRRTRIIIICIAVAVIIGVVAFCLVKKKSVYSSYSTEASVTRKDSGLSEYYKFGKGYVRCSKDGIAAFSYSGTQLWNKSFEINKTGIDICGSYMAIADIDGNEVYLFDTNGFVNVINTAMPVVQVNVSGQGLVVVSLKDTEATYINMYNRDGEKLYNIKSTISGDGVPVSMAVSDDGEKLLVSFVSVAGTEFNTSVVVYNFGEVGQSASERIVAGYDTYGSQLVSKVEFISKDVAVAFGENVISFFKVGEYAKLIKDVSVENKIEKIFYSSDKVGLVVLDENNSRTLEVYNTSGLKILSYKPEENYAFYGFTENNIVMYGGKNCCIINSKGRKLYSETMEYDISQMISLEGDKEFLLVTPKTIDKIKFK